MQVETELQTGEESTESLATGSESATEQPEGEAEGKPAEVGVDKDPAGYTKAINRKHFQFKEAERRADALAEENARLKAQVPGAVRPEIPALPDPYDENYAELIAQRDQAVQDAAKYDAEAAAEVAQQERAAAVTVKEQNDALVKSVSTYTERAEKLSVSEAELEVAATTIDAYGINGALVQHILADEQGPLITLHLAKNPAELAALQDMSLLDAAVYISTALKTKVMAGREGGAPPPADTLTGGGAPPAGHGPKGATYE